MIQRKSEQLRRKSRKNSILKGGSTFSKSNPRYIHESVLARFRAAFTGSWWWDERTQAEGYVGLDASVLSETAREKRSAFGRGGGGRLHR